MLERRPSIECCNFCITGINGGVITFCCLRYSSSSCETLSGTPTLSNRSSQVVRSFVAYSCLEWWFLDQLGDNQRVSVRPAHSY